MIRASRHFIGRGGGPNQPWRERAEMLVFAALIWAAVVGLSWLVKHHFL
jgi:hypothetical protein